MDARRFRRSFLKKKVVISPTTGIKYRDGGGQKVRGKQWSSFKKRRGKRERTKRKRPRKSGKKTKRP